MVKISRQHREMTQRRIRAGRQASDSRWSHRFRKSMKGNYVKWKGNRAYIWNRRYYPSHRVEQYTSSLVGPLSRLAGTSISRLSGEPASIAPFLASQRGLWHNDMNVVASDNFDMKYDFNYETPTKWTGRYKDVGEDITQDLAEEGIQRTVQRTMQGPAYRYVQYYVPRNVPLSRWTVPEGFPPAKPSRYDGYPTSGGGLIPTKPDRIVPIRDFGPDVRPIGSCFEWRYNVQEKIWEKVPCQKKGIQERRSRYPQGATLYRPRRNQRSSPRWTRNRRTTYRKRRTSAYYSVKRHYYR